ncbi:nucleoside phosphorylase [Pedobacter sp. SD-b]|uniref:Nucleoside phosphorylase n=1 Tax=Pedobacter segetis TaxID=2793069 RepID=A0ABS1BI48_9SPHI|nr:nucleoside phosphorylase [Pedobacter segetis]MBK0382565.1 nucleoside phosphorylase [Pedobacter segetis]
MKTISEADLIINPDGSIYHLNILPQDVADTIITVGDPDRVDEVSKHFDKIEIKKGKREFKTHTGFLGDKRITVISTGIGTDNIDIVLNELDALVNLDFTTRTVKNELKSLNIIRVGTSGSIREDIGVGTILASSHGLGLDALMNYYVQDVTIEDKYLAQAITQHLPKLNSQPYLTSASKKLLKKIAFDMPRGITATAPGFYAPQGRQVRAKIAQPLLLEKLSTFELHNQKITNLEMETAGIYALANALGHQALSINAILAHRLKFQFAKNPEKIVADMIVKVLERV